MTAYIKTKKKVDVKPSAIKEQVALFLRCDIENPSFDSQTKERLITAPGKFGSKPEIPGMAAIVISFFFMPFLCAILY